MALTTEQRQIIEQAKARGLSKEQAIALAFRPQASPEPSQGRFSDVGEDVITTGRELVSDFAQRGDNIRESFRAGAAGEQTPIETGLQMGAQVPLAVGDIIGRGVQAVGRAVMSQEEEEKTAQKIGEAVSATGLPEAYSGLSERTKRNIDIPLSLFEVATAGTGTTVTRPTISGVKQQIGNFLRRTPEQTASKIAPQTSDDVMEMAVQSLKNQADDVKLDPRVREEAARASLTWQQKAVGMTPQEKARLNQMGAKKFQEYLDAVHTSNIDDTAPTPYRVGALNVQKAQEALQTALNDTGSQIGKTRMKLASTKMPQTSVENIDRIFTGEIRNLDLVIQNGRIVPRKGGITPTSQGDITALNKLYNDLNTFKQSPTVENAIKLRKNFDATIKFGKKASEVSNEVDPVSRAVRATIAEEAAKSVGKEQASLVTQYSDFMDAYGDLQSYTRRSAGGEYLLRLVLSGRGGEAQDLIKTVKDYTGIDLMNDAQAMKIVTERFGNDNTKNLFRQEISNAGYDAAALLSGSPIGIGQRLTSRLIELGLDEENIYKAAASGMGGYVLATYSDDNGVLLPAGVVVLAAMPNKARVESIEQAAKAGKKLKLSDEMAEETIQTLMEYDSLPVVKKTSSPAFDDGIKNELDFGTDAEFRLEQLQTKNQRTNLTQAEIVEARALLEERGVLEVGESKKAKPAKAQTTDLVEQAKGKTLDAREITDIPDTPVKKTDKGNAILYWGGDKPLTELDINKMAPDTQNVRGGGVMVTNNPDYAELYARFTDNELRGRTQKVGREAGFIQTFELEKPLFDTSTTLNKKDVSAIKKSYEELLEIDADEAGFPNTDNAEKIWDWLTEDTGLDFAVIEDAGFGGIKEIGSNEVQIFNPKYLKNTNSKTISFNND